jgi:hypothetical protein
MLTVLHSPIVEEQTKQCFEQALAKKTDYADTHSCLADQLQSLGSLIAQSQTLSQPVTIQISVAENLLGSILHQFAAQFGQDWQTSVLIPWRQRYAYLHQGQAASFRAKTADADFI